MGPHDRDSDSPTGELGSLRPLEQPLLDEHTMAFIMYVIDEAICRHSRTRPLTPIELRSLAGHSINDNH